MARRQATSLSGSAEEWVDKAEATNDPSEKNRYYLQAAGLLAMRDQDFDRALSFVSKISNERKRNETATFLGMMAVGAALKKGDIEKAQEYIKSIPGTLERAVMMTVLANEFVTRGDRKKAREFLNGAEQFLEQTGDSGNKLKVLILLAFEDYRQSHYFRVTLYSRAAFTTWAKLHFRE